MRAKNSFNRKYLSAAILAASVAVCAPSFADVVIYTKSVDKSAEKSPSGMPYFTESGLSPETPPPVEGAGDNMSLDLTMKLIMPESWNYTLTGKSASRTPVKWQGGTSFSHTLKQMSEDNQIFINVDWVSKEVSVNVPAVRIAKAPTNTPAQTDVETNTNNDTYAAHYQQKRVDRDDIAAKKKASNSQVEMTIASQRKTQDEHSKFVAVLLEENQRAARHSDELQGELAETITKLAHAEEKLRVVYRKEVTNAPEPTQLADIFDARHVLPLDTSFDYFLKGGHQDTFELNTPATFIAKPGTLKEVLTAWAAEIGGGMEVDYRLNVDHHITHKRVFKGSFRESATSLVLKFKDSNRPVNISFHKDLGDHGVVLVTDLNYKKADPALNNLLHKSKG